MRRRRGLAWARENAIDELESCLKAVSRGKQNDVAFLSAITERYHILGIAVLLEDADPAGFATLLALAGQTDCHLRSLDLPQHPEKLIASRAEPFCDALVAGDLESARTLARLAPHQYQEGWEYEDDFLRFHFQHRLMLGDEDEALGRILQRWAEVLEGAESPHLDVGQALLARDAVALDKALLAMVRERKEKLKAWRKTPTYDEQLDATDGALLVRGLAVIRLAELRGISVPGEYEYMPSLARVPLGRPLPSPGSWKQPEIALGFA